MLFLYKRYLVWLAEKDAIIFDLKTGATHVVPVYAVTDGWH